MPRRSVGKDSSRKDDVFDYHPMINSGITMLKFGRSGKPHERLFKLSSDLRYLKWYSGWFSAKIGAKSSGKLALSLNSYVGNFVDTYLFSPFIHH